MEYEHDEDDDDDDDDDETDNEYDDYDDDDLATADATNADLHTDPVFILFYIKYLGV